MALIIKRLLAVFPLFLSVQAFSQCLTISSFPYNEGFETSAGNWFTGGTNNDWTWGSPTKPTINSAGTGVNCWITGGPVASFYNLGERSWVQSPCFDFTNLNKPYVTFLIFWETERSYDGGNFQYSIDGGITWVTVGVVNETDTCSTHNWYNISHITNLSQVTSATQGWSGTVLNPSGGCSGGGGSGGWKLATHCLENLAHLPLVKFRFTFGSGTTCNDFDGIAFDDVYIGEGPNIPSGFSMTCVDEYKIRFQDTYRNCRDSWSWDFGDPTSSSNNATGSLADHVFTSGGTFNVTLTATGGCSPDGQVTLPVNLISYTMQSIEVSCIDLSDGMARIDLLNPIPVTYTWSHDANLNAAIANGLSPGNYSVIIDDGFCPVDVDFNIGFAPNANPVVNLGEDTVICPGTSFVLKPGKYSSYLWQDNSTDSIFIVKSNGTYSVRIRNSSGCSTTDSIVVEEDCLNDIILPNAFTPNGDGLNEMFFVSGSETDIFEIFIFDRWGEMIFRSPDRSKGWDGTMKGHPVQEGFYNYLVNYTIGKEDRTKSGSVFVIR